MTTNGNARCPGRANLDMPPRQESPSKLLLVKVDSHCRNPYVVMSPQKSQSPDNNIPMKLSPGKYIIKIPSSLNGPVPTISVKDKTPLINTQPTSSQQSNTTGTNTPETKLLAKASSKGVDTHSDIKDVKKKNKIKTKQKKTEPDTCETQNSTKKSTKRKIKENTGEGIHKQKKMKETKSKPTSSIMKKMKSTPVSENIVCIDSDEEGIYCALSLTESSTELERRQSSPSLTSNSHCIDIGKKSLAECTSNTSCVNDLDLLVGQSEEACIYINDSQEENLYEIQDGEAEVTKTFRDIKNIQNENSLIDAPFRLYSHAHQMYTPKSYKEQLEDSRFHLPIYFTNGKNDHLKPASKGLFPKHPCYALMNSDGITEAIMVDELMPGNYLISQNSEPDREVKLREASGIYGYKLKHVSLSTYYFCSRDMDLSIPGQRIIKLHNFSEEINENSDIQINDQDQDNWLVDRERIDGWLASSHPSCSDDELYKVICMCLDQTEDIVTKPKFTFKMKIQYVDHKKKRSGSLSNDKSNNTASTSLRND